MIDVLNATANFIQTNNNGFFTIVGVIIGGLITYLITIGDRKKEERKIRKNLAQGYLFEIEALEKMIDRALANEKGALPKIIPIYPNSGIFHLSKKETLCFSSVLYKKLNEFYSHILKAEYYRHESHYSMRQGKIEFEAARLAFLNQLYTDRCASDELKRLMDSFQESVPKTGELVFSDGLMDIIKIELEKAKGQIPELKRLLNDEMT